MADVDQILQTFESRISALEGQRKRADARDDELLANVREVREMVLDTRKDLSEMSDVVIEARSETKIVGSTVSRVLRKVEALLKHSKANGTGK